MQQPQPSDSPKAQKMVVSSGKNENLGYLIAAIIFGAAVGNMFLAGKIRNVMNIKVKSPFPNSNSSNNYKNFENAGSKDSKSSYVDGKTDHMKYRNPNKKAYIRIPQSIQNDLKLLEISLLNDLKIDTENINADNCLSEIQTKIKDSYRKAALQFHPDRLTIDDKRRAIYENKFKDISKAYNNLLKYFEENQRHLKL